MCDSNESYLITTRKLIRDELVHEMSSLTETTSAFKLASSLAPPAPPKRSRGAQHYRLILYYLENAIDTMDSPRWGRIFLLPYGGWDEVFRLDSRGNLNVCHYDEAKDHLVTDTVIPHTWLE